MAHGSENDDRRREFLRSLVRYPLLGALGALGGYLATRPPAAGPVQAGQNCINRSICRACRRLAECSLPQGLMARSTSNHEQAKPYERTF